ncbi:putative membrane protein [Oikeobacillus pervagus]|uniref:Membrane protein n=1 Tax=Oikeobacillus pervagus TaxID=1325931 RepID=A0AAJ1WI52_9BACI|nr:cytochrome c oxidase assembly protein [Oikeobacillus pervagus]MDQ0213988.1 putative membrane protein [Oikeobacillus pervagus]
MFSEKLISQQTWYEWWNPVYFLVVLLFAYLYKRFVIGSDHEEAVSKKQMNYFYISLILFYIMNGSPFNVMADQYLFSAHVLGLSILLFVIPPFFILSLPMTRIRQYFWNHQKKELMNFLLHPWFTGITFNVALTLYLTPRVFNVIHESPFFSFLYQLLLFAAALFVWWTIIVQVPGLKNLSEFGRICYIFLLSLLLMPIGIYLLIGENLSYQMSEIASFGLLPAFTGRYDHQLAGGILKTIQLLSYGIAMFIIMRNWARREEAEEGKVPDENIRLVQGVVIHLKENNHVKRP